MNAINCRIFFAAMLILDAHHTVKANILEGINPWKKNKEEIVSLTQAMPSNCSISVTNKNGNITIKTWHQPRVVIEAIKIGSDRAIESTKIRKSVAKNHHLHIETIQKDTKTSCTVNYNILAPTSARLETLVTDNGTITVANASNGVAAKSQRGNIKLDNVTGPIKTITKHGSIEIVPAEITADQKIMASAGRGNIKLALPQEASAKVSLSTKKGRIISDIPITMSPRKMKFNARTLAQLKREAQGSIGSEESMKSGTTAAIKLHTESGNINIVNS